MFPPTILYVEDEETDVLLLRLAFTRAGLPNPIHRAADGAEAVDYLVSAFGLHPAHGLPCGPGNIVFVYRTTETRG